MIKIIIAGGRDFDDYTLMLNSLIEVFLKIKDEGHYLHKDIVEIISGGAKGADALGEKIANNHKIKLTKFPAEWDNFEDETCKIRYNKFGEPYNVLAGFNRNIKMAQYAKDSDLGILLAFWDGKSGGTKHMIDTAKKNGLDVHIIKYSNSLW